MIKVNGKVINTGNGSNIQSIIMNENGIIINGKNIDDFKKMVGDEKEIHIVIADCTIGSLDCTTAELHGCKVQDIDCNTCKVEGNVDGNIDGNNIRVFGDVKGNVDGDVVNVGGDIHGKVKADIVNR